MTAHKHAALMLQYAQDWAKTDEPWKRWEVAYSSNKWGPLCGHPYWNEENEYRRKPRTLTYTVTIPEPLREAPKYDENYYYPVLDGVGLFYSNRWTGSASDTIRFKRGLCFETIEDAIAAARAMLSIKVEEA